jgi:hypothetical protein
MDLKKYLMPSAILTIVVTAVAYLMSMIGQPVQQLYSIGGVSLVSGVTPTIGNKVLAFVAGYFPQVGSFAIPAIIILWISAFAILLAGDFIRGALKIDVGGRVANFAMEILLGTALFYVLIIGFVMKSWQVFAGLAIHTVIAAYVTAFILDKVK